MKYELKPIPENAVVHTPTEAEAKELLEILHENGYEWYHKYAPIPNPNLKEVVYINIYKSLNGCNNVITYCDEKNYIDRFLTLAEFKSKYSQEEPRYKVGDKVRVINDCGCNACGLIGVVNEVNSGSIDVVCDDFRLSCLYEWIEPYTEPTEELNEVNFAKNQKLNNSDMETKELNLCELLKGHEGETFFSQIWGDVTLNALYPTNNGGNQPLVNIRLSNKNTRNITSDGYLSYGERFGYVVIWPSRALYEQYPLDPAKAWSVWQEEQKKPFICIHYGEVDCNGDEEEDYTGNTYFRTLADRDKAIEVIDAFLKQIGQSKSVASLCEEINALIGKYVK